ncbi:succinate-semialdehyde dehydrogenase / glutarate-semialdehyde dehydrogenase [Agrococcus baldri]|uniref:Succinate-semialdehyde dehydrogenase / glutarate-semialdehyde dehydrogenase n=1 Tax=Agrococcus baldri TaxID=153730 RepID=A0AA94HNJ1_9MICO|nr:NAD-dependent succinate-semialdehyde dehydrogenase [Agrococcus baldri]SFS15771.1 succinate-semialdehyde dehydrogenase / glutarate-semialdehyde dehydrogenase [Agrococcus baldri]
MSEYKVTDPYTGQIVKEYPTATDDEIRAAIERAHAAYEPWATTPMAERAAILSKAADAFTSRSQELAEIIRTEMGKPLGQAKDEAEFSGDIIRYYADNAEEFLADEVLKTASGVDARIRKSAQGVILGIMPWNFPYYQVARFAFPNLMLGNTVLLKHAPQCPWSATVIAEILAEAGLPAGAYENIFATNEQIGEIVIPDARVRGVSLTGSERAGAAVAEIAGRNLKKVVLELGGSDPFVVLSTDDMDAVVQAAVDARMENSGQSCNASKRFIVLDELYDEFSSKLGAAITGMQVGEADDADALVGALSSQAAADRLREQTSAAVAEGAEVLAGALGHHGDTRVQPALLGGVTEQMDAYREELFGPVGTVYRAKDVDDAVRIANGTPFGLGARVWATDPELALAVADRIDAGMVSINGAGAEDYDMPFGGTKRSGFGRELGPHGMEEFMNKKLIVN